MFNTYNLTATPIRGTLLWHMRQQPQPNDFFKKNRWRGGLNVKKLLVAVSIAKRRIPNPPQLGDIDLKQAQY